MRKNLQVWNEPSIAFVAEAQQKLDFRFCVWRYHEIACSRKIFCVSVCASVRPVCRRAAGVPSSAEPARNPNGLWAGNGGFVQLLICCACTSKICGGRWQRLAWHRLWF